MDDPNPGCDPASLMASALRQALERLQMLGLVDDDSHAASKTLSRLIADAVARGEQNQENMILYAIGRFQVQRLDERKSPDGINRESSSG